VASSWAGLADEARLVARSFAERITHFNTPILRLGVTGLARAGKSVFITAFVQALMSGERLPVFELAASGRLRRAVLKPQPDDAVPRFGVEEHLSRLIEKREWPDSTRRIAQLRLDIDYEGKTGSGPRHLILDLVDYPGEWLIDLALMEVDYRTFSREAMVATQGSARQDASAAFRALASSIDPQAPASEALAEQLANTFRTYLLACRAEPLRLSVLPPGRFLMPGDLEGSPALTFSPLMLDEAPFVPGSLAALMEHRYEAYRQHVVRPFFRDHFARLDRQIVLIDVLSALEAGPAALADLETAIGRVLLAFRAGRTSWIGRLFTPRIDKVLFCATKADHVHHGAHDRLEKLLGLIIERAMKRIESAGATVQVAALASVRATREALVKEGGRDFPALVGIPEAGQRLGERLFDGQTQTAIYTGDLPANPRDALTRPLELTIPRFRPPAIERRPDGHIGTLPHIRLDRALQFLIGDKLD
jgi:uncharacterized protein